MPWEALIPAGALVGLGLLWMVLVLRGGAGG